ncbi:hypothetical protein COOONC_14385 [Cooperia oncophora]
MRLSAASLVVRALNLSSTRSDAYESGQGSLYVFTGVLFLFGYTCIQDEVNPDSKWAEIYRAITQEPLKWMGADKTAATRPAPSLSSPLRQVH